MRVIIGVAVNLPAEEITEAHAYHKQSLADCKLEHLLRGLDVKTLIVLLHKVITYNTEDIPYATQVHFIFIYYLVLALDALQLCHIAVDNIGIIKDIWNQTVSDLAMNLVFFLQYQNQNEIYSE